MIIEFLNMNGFGLYVWSAFLFTLISFAILFYIIKNQYVRERNKFLSKFGALDSKKAEIAKSQITNKEILSSTQFI